MAQGKLCVAVRGGNKQLARKLVRNCLSKGNGLTEVMSREELSGKTALMVACEEGHTEFVDLLVDAPLRSALDDAVLEYLSSGLLRAIAKQQVKATASLVSKIANLPVEDRKRVATWPMEKTGLTPLLLASGYPDVHILKEVWKLYNYEAADDATEEWCSKADGMTPLMIAAWKGREENVKFLLERLGAADIAARIRNVADNTGYTALHWAAARGHTGVCESLVTALKENERQADCSELLNEARNHCSHTKGRPTWYGVAMASGHEATADRAASLIYAVG